MNIDFALYNPPKMNYDPLSLWGQVIFIPKREDTPRNKDFAAFFNCYRVKKEQDVQLSVEAARMETYGLPIEESTTSTKDSDDYEIKYNIPCLFLNSMVRSKYLILYFHASGEDIKLSYKMLNYLRNLYQINVIAMEYPGYSLYKGTPKAQRINEDAQYVYNYIVNDIGFAEDNIIIIGRSIGTGTALHVAQKKNPAVVALISAFTSVKNLAKDFVGGWTSLFLKESFDNIEAIKSVKCPVFFLHGKSDTFIPHQNTLDLAKYCRGPHKIHLAEKMTHSAFDFYEDLSNPLRDFLLNTVELDLYHQEMRGPEIPSILFKNPLAM